MASTFADPVRRRGLFQLGGWEGGGRAAGELGSVEFSLTRVLRRFAPRNRSKLDPAAADSRRTGAPLPASLGEGHVRLPKQAGLRPALLPGEPPVEAMGES